MLKTEYYCEMSYNHVKDETEIIMIQESDFLQGGVDMYKGR